MKNGRKEEFVFHGVKQTLARYRADARYAQELRRLARLYVEDNLDIIAQDEASPTDADKLLRRLARSDVALLSIFVKRGPTAKTRGQNVAKAMYERMAKSKGFAAFVHYTIAPKTDRASILLDLRHAPGTRKAILKVLDRIWHEHAADHNGWHYLLKKEDERTGAKHALVKTSYRSFKEAQGSMPQSGFDFISRTLLGYTKNVTWEEAARLDAIDPLQKEIFGGWASVSIEDAPMLRENRGLETDKKAKLVVDPSKGAPAASDLLLPLWEEEEAFYFDPGFYLDPEKNPKPEMTNVLSTKVSVRQALENKALLKRLTQLDVTPYLDDTTVASFTPSLTNQKNGRGGSRSYWAKELGKSTCVVGSVVKSDAKPRWPADAPSDQWLADRQGKRAVDAELEAERLERQALLDADAAEVREHAPSDVPETILTLLEQQVQETKRKAPKGVIGALAAARLEMQRNRERIAQHLSGLTALEHAAAPASV